MNIFLGEKMLKDSKKYLFIFSLFFILILSLGVISASEDIDDQIDNGSSDLIRSSDISIDEKLNENNEIDESYQTSIENEKLDSDILAEGDVSEPIILNGGKFSDISNAVNRAQSGDTIQLSGYFEGDGKISVSKSINFIGSPNATLDAKNLSSIFYFTSRLEGFQRNYSFVISNLNFINANNAAIHFQNQSSTEASNPSLENLTIINCSFMNNKGLYGGAIFYQRSSSRPNSFSVVNCSFVNNSASGGGGAIYFSTSDREYYMNIFNTSSFSSCSFVNNSASGDGGAVFIEGYCNYTSFSSCSFVNNSASGDGGAIYHFSQWNDGRNCINEFSANNCSFLNNSASKGGAISFYNGTIKNCSFENNRAIIEGGAIVFTRDGFSGYSTIANSIFKNNIAKGFGSAILQDNDSSCKLKITNCSFLNNIAYGEYNSLDFGFRNWGNGTICSFSFGPDRYLLMENCQGLVSKNANKFKKPTKINSSSVSLVYKGGKYLVARLITVPTNNNLLRGLQVTIKINGKTYKKYCNADAYVKLLINLAPKTYTAKISFAGDNFFLNSSKSVKVVVKKATPKLTASKKTFKLKVKTKKYTVTLKNHKKTVLKKYKLTLKVKGKTFTAKTNSKGKATFKITNLKKKGTFNAVVKFAGNKYYKKISKTVKIPVK